ncbi:MAG: STAS domain-containing protein [Actinomycetota bacterium]|nr:STAS domain-containing protein [Actinomycetota bacterium]
MSQVVQEAGGSNCAVYRFVGELDALTAQRLRQVLARMASSPKAVIDLSEVVFIDSTGLNALVGGIRRIRECGGQVAVSSSSPQVRRLLTLTGFEKIVLLADSVDEAAGKLAD